MVQTALVYWPLQNQGNCFRGIPGNICETLGSTKSPRKHQERSVSRNSFQWAAEERCQAAAMATKQLVRCACPCTGTQQVWFVRFFPTGYRRRYKPLPGQNVVSAFL